MTKETQIKQLEQDWAENSRWKNVTRPYTAEDVVRLRCSINIEHTLEKIFSEKL
ncbi:MAG: isocitrate lyase, partial [Burkholderiales bacterium]